MATTRPRSATPTSSATRSAKPRSKSHSDPLTELHVLRREIAAEFGYSAARIMAHADSLPIPSWIRVINIKDKTKPKP